MDFNEAIEHVLAKEGGYVNDPKDSGGETNWGISKRSYPHLNIKELTRLQAIEIYRRDYWQKIRADELPEKIRLNVFDFAVNAGVPTAIKLLQTVSGAKPDGIIGNETLKASKKLTSRLYAIGRIKHYTALAKKRPKDQVFLNGWLTRTLDITLISMF